MFSAPLRWASDPETADHICCQQHHFAEFAGYWETTSFPRQLPAGESRITFYDVTTHRPLYVAPVGRSWDEFYVESQHHGWPSFRDEEVVHENVFVADDGDILSVNGTRRGLSASGRCLFAIHRLDVYPVTASDSAERHGREV